MLYAHMMLLKTYCIQTLAYFLSLNLTITHTFIPPTAVYTVSVTHFLQCALNVCQVACLFGCYRADAT